MHAVLICQYSFHAPTGGPAGATVTACDPPSAGPAWSEPATGSMCRSSRISPSSAARQASTPAHTNASLLGPMYPNPAANTLPITYPIASTMLYRLVTKPRLSAVVRISKIVSMLIHAATENAPSIARAVAHATSVPRNGNTAVATP